MAWCRESGERACYTGTGAHHSMRTQFTDEPYLVTTEGAGLPIKRTSTSDGSRVRRAAVNEPANHIDYLPRDTGKTVEPSSNRYPPEKPTNVRASTRPKQGVKNYVRHTWLNAAPRKRTTSVEPTSGMHDGLTSRRFRIAISRPGLRQSRCTSFPRHALTQQCGRGFDRHRDIGPMQPGARPTQRG